MPLAARAYPAPAYRRNLVTTLLSLVHNDIINRAGTCLAPSSSTSAVSISVPIVRRSGKSKIFRLAGAIQMNPNGLPDGAWPSTSATTSLSTRHSLLAGESTQVSSPRREPPSTMSASSSSTNWDGTNIARVIRAASIRTLRVSAIASPVR